MNTDKPGQQSNQQDPTQRDRDNEKSGQQQHDQQGHGQNDPQKDRKPGQGQQGDIERDKKSA